MDTNEQNQQDKRELRHKRRQRNQIIAYTAVGNDPVAGGGNCFCCKQDYQHES